MERNVYFTVEREKKFFGGIRQEVVYEMWLVDDEHVEVHITAGFFGEDVECDGGTTVDGTVHWTMLPEWLQNELKQKIDEVIEDISGDIEDLESDRSELESLLEPDL